MPTLKMSLREQMEAENSAKVLGWCYRALLINLYCPQASRCPSLAPSHKNYTKAPRDLAATWPADRHQSFLSKQTELSFHLSRQSDPPGPPLRLLQPFLLGALWAAGGLGASAFNLTGLGALGSAPLGRRPTSRCLRGWETRGGLRWWHLPARSRSRSSRVAVSCTPAAASPSCRSPTHPSSRRPGKHFAEPGKLTEGAKKEGGGGAACWGRRLKDVVVVCLFVVSDL